MDNILDHVVVQGQRYDIVSPTAFGDYIETIGSACINPDGYAQGSTFLAKFGNEQFYYEATAAITQGSAISEGTNCKRTTVTEREAELAADINSLNEALTNKTDAISSVISANGAVNLLPCDFADGVINGVTFIKNSDGTVSVNGKSVNLNAWSIRSIGAVYVKQGERYKVSGCPSGGSENTYEMFFVTRDGNGTGINSLEETGNGGYITVPSGAVKIDAYIRCYYDVQVNNLVFKPMITLADQPNSDYAHYVPYAMTNRELTEGCTIGNIDISLSGIAVTGSDSAGYYAEKVITSDLPNGAYPFAVILTSGYTGGLSYTVGFVGSDWKVILSSSKSFTMPTTGLRNAKVLYVKQNIIK